MQQCQNAVWTQSAFQSLSFQALLVRASVHDVLATQPFQDSITTTTPMSCVSFSDRRTGSSCAASSNPISFSFLKLGIVCVSCFVQGTVAYSLLLCKHGSQRVVIPHFLTFLTPSLRFFPTLCFISVHGVHLYHVHITMSRPPR